MEMPEDRTWNLWIRIIREAFACLDFKDFNWMHLPENGGYYDQDEFFLIIWECIRQEVVKAYRDESFKKSMVVKNG